MNQHWSFTRPSSTMPTDEWQPPSMLLGHVSSSALFPASDADHVPSALRREPGPSDRQTHPVAAEANQQARRSGDNSSPAPGQQPAPQAPRQAPVQQNPGQQNPARPNPVQQTPMPQAPAPKVYAMPAPESGIVGWLNRVMDEVSTSMDDSPGGPGQGGPGQRHSWAPSAAAAQLTGRQQIPGNSTQQIVGQPRTPGNRPQISPVPQAPAQPVTGAQTDGRNPGQSSRELGSTVQSATMEPGLQQPVQPGTTDEGISFAAPSNRPAGRGMDTAATRRGFMGLGTMVAIGGFGLTTLLGMDFGSDEEASSPGSATADPTTDPSYLADDTYLDVTGEDATTMGTFTLPGQWSQIHGDDGSKSPDERTWMDFHDDSENRLMLSSITLDVPTAEKALAAVDVEMASKTAKKLPPPKMQGLDSAARRYQDSEVWCAKRADGLYLVLIGIPKTSSWAAVHEVMQMVADSYS